MPSIFTRIIDGELPGRFVWRDGLSVAFLSIAPMNPGHTLVVPRAEVDQWIDLDPSVAEHLVRVAQTVGRAQRMAFSARRIGLMIVGDEVPHAHVHVVPINAAFELSFEHVDPNPSPEALDVAAAELRGALRELDASGVADA